MTGCNVQITSVSKNYETVIRSRNFFEALLLSPQRKQHQVFDRFSLTVEAGAKVLIYAKNGTGKTTLLKMLAGFAKPQQGKILLGERCVSKIPKSSIGLMLSEFFLYPKVSVYENLRFNALLNQVEDVSESVEAAIRNWNLAGFSEKRIEELSNGQKSLVALARSTVHKPKLLLWDEPHVFLSEENREVLANFIRSSAQTILVTTAVRTSDEIFDRVVEF